MEGPSKITHFNINSSLVVSLWNPKTCDAEKSPITHRRTDLWISIYQHGVSFLTSIAQHSCWYVISSSCSNRCTHYFQTSLWRPTTSSLCQIEVPLYLLSQHLLESCMKASLVRSWSYIFFNTYFLLHFDFNFHNLSHKNCQRIIYFVKRTRQSLSLFQNQQHWMIWIIIIIMVESDTSRVVTTTPFSDAGIATVPPSVRLSHRPTNHPPSFTHRRRLAQPLTGRGRPNNSSRYGHYRTLILLDL